MSVPQEYTPNALARLRGVLEPPAPSTRFKFGEIRRFASTVFYLASRIDLAFVPRVPDFSAMDILSEDRRSEFDRELGRKRGLAIDWASRLIALEPALTETLERIGHLLARKLRAKNAWDGRLSELQRRATELRAWSIKQETLSAASAPGPTADMNCGPNDATGEQAPAAESESPTVSGPDAERHGDGKATAANAEPDKPIDVDFPNPSAPISKKYAADAWGGGMGVRKLTELMESGRVRHKKLSRQLFIFCREDVPNLPLR